ncbi:DNA-binding protein [Corynebacterium sp. SCR221107]|uniref:helix-turn-helix transcriptional regulator n=1 Tax=Corynebacterium sp. SCR221107 TaxID=3017361 RepID=UPI0022EC8667|nr:DNA-binding protein [Corynebacterium sp. SCR221107]WBT08994.1 DNA-binding protein [Corynebacterium sp. SCR221107]
MSDYTPDDMIKRFPNTTRQTWAQKRYDGTGPKFYKVGRRVFYRPQDVDEWVESQIKTRTDEIPAA